MPNSARLRLHCHTATMSLHLHLKKPNWRTVEFGPAIEHSQTRILGAGILSSFGESACALEHHGPVRQLFDMPAVLGTPYQSDIFEDRYFVIEDLSALVGRIQHLSWRELLAIELGQ